MTERSYRFFVKPTRRGTDENFSTLLVANDITPAESEVASIGVGTETVYGVYQVPHAFVTMLKNSEHRTYARVFVQEGEGEIRPYALFKKRSGPRASTHAKKVSTMLKERTS